MIAFGPVVFQVAKVARDKGILKVIEDSGSKGLTIEEIAEVLSISESTVKREWRSAKAWLSAQII